MVLKICSSKILLGPNYTKAIVETDSDDCSRWEAGWRILKFTLAED